MTKTNKKVYTVMAVFFGVPLLIAACLSVFSEHHTELTVDGGNPPKFILSGSGELSQIRVRGPHKQRDMEGEDASMYWLIKGEGRLTPIEDLSPLTYGKVPKGYTQVYPEKGTAPPLVEGERYYIHVSTANANGDSKYFIIHDGRVFSEKY